MPEIISRRVANSIIVGGSRAIVLTSELPHIDVFNDETDIIVSVIRGKPNRIVLEGTTK